MAKVKLVQTRENKTKKQFLEQKGCNERQVGEKMALRELCCQQFTPCFS